MSSSGRGPSLGGEVHPLSLLVHVPSQTASNWQAGTNEDQLKLSSSVDDIDVESDGGHEEPQLV